MFSAQGATPCGVLFDTFKRVGGVSHREFAGLVLSSRPLAGGRSPVALAYDRAWLSRFVVRAPVASVQERYFADYAAAAARVSARVRSKHARCLTSEQILDMLCGDDGRAMDAALADAGSDVHVYRNALDRIAHAEGCNVSERADAALVLFVAAGCSASARRAVSYTLDYLDSAWGSSAVVTPSSADAAALLALGIEHAEAALSLGLIREVDGYATGSIHWVDPAGEGSVLGALALGEGDVTDVSADVSAKHARVYCKDGAWMVEDLGSTNGTEVLRAGSEALSAVPGEPVEIAPGDELRLGASTLFALVAGTPKAWA